MSPKPEFKSSIIANYKLTHDIGAETILIEGLDGRKASLEKKPIYLEFFSFMSDLIDYLTEQVVTEPGPVVELKPEQNKTVGKITESTRIMSEALDSLIEYRRLIAVVQRKTFEHYIQSGFTEDQALELIAEIGVS